MNMANTAACTSAILQTVYALMGTASCGGWYGRSKWNRSVSSGSLPGESAPHPDLSLFFPSENQDPA